MTVIRASLPSGRVLDDPLPEHLLELFADVASGYDEFIIVERLDLGDEHFAQAVCLDGDWIVEVRGGSEASHVQAMTPSMEAAHGVLVAWTYGSGDWRTMAPWQPVF